MALLKLFLGTVSAGTGQQQVSQSSPSSIFPPGVASPLEQPLALPPTLDDLDVTEITSKAVLAILLLTLKWFKASCGNFPVMCISTSLMPASIGHKWLVIDFEDVWSARSFKYLLYRKPILLTTNHAEIVQKPVASYMDACATQELSGVKARAASFASNASIHVLKPIKSQVPFCGRQWRQSNMKVITSIYLNCPPDLHDEWLTGTEVDDISDAQAQEQALRHLPKYYNNKRYGPQITNQQSQAHRRSAPGLDLGNIIRPIGTPNVVEADVFPPPRSQAPDPSIFLPYITEDLAFEDEYEEYLSDLGWSDEQSEGPLFGSVISGGNAWQRLPELVTSIADNISDSESVVSIGDLGDDSRLDVGRDNRDIPDENLNNWE
ncbi:hypothetical protein M405DRAFT_847911, partial [Rhizopogon salebrosus TDB-379]